MGTEANLIGVISNPHVCHACRGNWKTDAMQVAGIRSCIFTIGKLECAKIIVENERGN